MIPDTIAGGLILAVVNMTVVFAVLIVIAFMINLIHRTASAGDGKKATEGAGSVDSGTQVASQSVAQQDLDPEPVPFDALDARRKAAIVAALHAYLGHKTVPVFVRRIPDAGIWGKTSRIHALR